MANPREIDAPLVDAYLARRALDYLVGFTLSPVLWRKLPGARSAGRVQSVALRLVCDRELEIEAFLREEYWTRSPPLLDTPRADSFEARLIGFDGKRLQKLDISSQAQADDIRAMLDGASFRAVSVEAKPTRRNPLPALHHLDAAAGGLAQARLLGHAHHADRAAPLRGRRHRRRDRRPHHLHANRRRADRAGGDRRRRAASSPEFGDRYLPGVPRYKTKAKNAQEAHEAIRPPTMIGDDPGELRAERRPGPPLRADLEAHHRQPDGLRRDRAHHRRDRRRQRRQGLHLRATGSVVRFDGFLAALRPGRPTTTRGRGEGKPPARRRSPRRRGAGRSRAEKDRRPTSTSPSRRRATPRRRWSSAWRSSASAGPRPMPRPWPCWSTASTCASTRSASFPRTRAASSRIPGKLLQTLCRIRLHRRSGGEARPDLRRRARLEGRAARLLARLHRRRRRDQGPARLRRARRAQRGCSARTSSRPARTARSAPLPELRHRHAVASRLGKFGAFIGCSNYPECRYTRQFGAESAENGGEAEGPKLLGKDPYTSEEITLRNGRFGPYLQLGEGKDGEALQACRRAGRPTRWTMRRRWRCCRCRATSASTPRAAR